MSTAWYKSRTVPKLVQKFVNNNNNKTKKKNVDLIIEVWETTCIVTNFAKEANCTVLVNPANPSLSGVSKFPYFPRGGPEPKLPPTKDSHPIMGYVTQWGGMDVGNGMMFSANVVDGLVHQLGGKDLARELDLVLQKQQQEQSSGGGSSGRIIKEGNSVWTSGVGEYLHLIHTIPPFYSKNGDNNNNNNNNDDDDDSSSTTANNDLLQECYKNSLQLAIHNNNNNNNNQDTAPAVDEIRLACPLLGAGCRGFPIQTAIDHCIQGVTNWDYYFDDDDDFNNNNNNDKNTNTTTITLAFGIPTLEVRSMLMESLDLKFTQEAIPNK